MIRSITADMTSWIVSAMGDCCQKERLGGDERDDKLAWQSELRVCSGLY